MAGTSTLSRASAPGEGASRAPGYLIAGHGLCVRGDTGRGGTPSRSIGDAFCAGHHPWQISAMARLFLHASDAPSQVPFDTGNLAVIEDKVAALAPVSSVGRPPRFTPRWQRTPSAADCAGGYRCRFRANQHRGFHRRCAGEKSVTKISCRLLGSLRFPFRR